MDVSNILSDLAAQRKQLALQLIALNRAAKILRKMRGLYPNGKSAVSLQTSRFAERSARMKRAWRTRRANQRAKLHLVNGHAHKKAA